MIVNINLDDIVNAIIEMNDAPYGKRIILANGLEIRAWEVKDISTLCSNDEITIINAYINRIDSCLKSL